MSDNQVMIPAQLLNRLGMTASVDIDDKTVNIKDMLKETISYLDTNFENWRKSPFLKFGYSIKKGFKHIALWGVALLYKMKLPMIYINTYRFLVDKLKIDIKF